MGLNTMSLLAKHGLDRCNGADKPIESRLTIRDVCPSLRKTRRLVICPGIREDEPEAVHGTVSERSDTATRPSSFEAQPSKSRIGGGISRPSDQELLRGRRSHTSKQPSMCTGPPLTSNSFVAWRVAFQPSHRYRGRDRILLKGERGCAIEAWLSALGRDQIHCR